MARSSRRFVARGLIIAIAVAMLVPVLAAPAFADVDAAPVWRFYNQSTGSHFYTASGAERDAVSSKYSTLFTFEGPAWMTADADWWEEAQTAPLYRFYNKKNGSHFYTVSEAEKAKIIASYGATYAYEGVAYDVFLNDRGSPAVPVYRFYNKKNGSHFYTISEAEKSMVQMNHGATYQYEGIAFYAFPYQRSPA